MTSTERPKLCWGPPTEPVVCCPPESLTPSLHPAFPGSGSRRGIWGLVSSRIAEREENIHFPKNVLSSGRAYTPGPRRGGPAC